MYYNWTLLCGGNSPDFQVASSPSESTAVSNSWEMSQAGVGSVVERWMTMAMVS